MLELEYPFDSQFILLNKKKLKNILLKQKNLTEKKILILSGSTIGDIQNVLELFLFHHGIKPVFYQGQYGRFYEEAVFPTEEMREFHPDIIYLHTTVKNICNYPDIMDEKKTMILLEAEYSKFLEIWESLKKFNCPVIQNNFEIPLEREMGNDGICHHSGRHYYINCLNQKLYQYAQENQHLYIQDLQYEAARFGLFNWFDNKAWHLYRYAFRVEAIPHVCHNLANIIKALFGKNKKALVLDLDNTLWGGTIGDDGINHIALGADTAEGEIYSDFQKYLKRISDQGTILAVCSKNQDSIARKAFDHPESVLKISDFTVFKANWLEKDRNIAEIAHQLNILPESIVFLDDNPAERQLVKESLPQISVPELDKKENYLDRLDRSGFFESVVISSDDKNRKVYYRENAEREQACCKFANYDEFLISLQMKCEIGSIRSENAQRVLQLINKTNQFNVTARRCSYAEIEEYMQNPDYLTSAACLKDKYGSNGIVSVLAGKIQEKQLVIETWVMSCRVFKRDLELAVWDNIVLKCKKRNISQIFGTYTASGKNNYVRFLYQKLGFTGIEQEDGQECWLYQIPKDYCTKSRHMEIIENEQRRDIQRDQKHIQDGF